MINRDKIINFDFQGWPEEKMSIKDILISLGAELKNGKWIIDDDPKLDTIFPKAVVDDGMGYGVEEEYITCVSFNKDREYCSIFREKAIEHPSIWLECRVCPGSVVDIDGKSWMIEHIDETDDGYVFITREWLYTGKKDEKIRIGETKSFPVDMIKNLDENLKFIV